MKMFSIGGSKQQMRSSVWKGDNVDIIPKNILTATALAVAAVLAALPILLHSTWLYL